MEENRKSPRGIQVEMDKKASSEDYFADFDLSSLDVSVENMLKNGVHFGHQKSRKDPRMEEYIFTTRKGISIIDLQKTLEKLEEAFELIRKIKNEGKKIIFVGTKKQAKDIIKSAAIKCGMPYVVERWLGGTLTNFKAIKGRTRYLKDSQDKLAQGEFKKYTKFEQVKKSEELEKLEKKMGGIKYLDEMPGAVFVTDIKEDELAIREAKKVNVPVIALSDTNVNPSLVNYPIPANDDAVSSVRLMAGYICKVILEK
jgi:small subunit ribosomal protein S2